MYKVGVCSNKQGSCIEGKESAATIKVVVHRVVSAATRGRGL